MNTGRALAILLALVAGPVLDGAHGEVRFDIPAALGALAGQQTAQQGNQQLIPPSMALRLALRYSPGSTGLDVTLMERGRLVYAVKLKTRNRVHRVLVDARTGQVLGD